MVLNGKDMFFSQSQSFRGPVVQVEVGQFRQSFEGFDIDGKTMVLASDLDGSSLQVFNGMIAPTMPEFKLIGLSP